MYSEISVSGTFGDFDQKSRDIWASWYSKLYSDFKYSLPRTLLELRVIWVKRTFAVIYLENTIGTGD